MELRSGQGWPTNFDKGRLIRVKAVSADFTGARMSDGDLTQANFQNALLRRTILTDAVMTMADLRGADLKGADLRGAKDFDLPERAR